MSNNWVHKIQNYELTPPANSWEKIAGELDDLYLTQQFPSTLYNTEIAPPVNAWAAISAALDEVATVNRFPSTLYNLEAAPPLAAWDKIEAALDQQEARPIPQRKRIIPFVRYAAAAVILGALAFGSLRLINGSSTKEQELATGDNQIPANKQVITTPPATIENRPGTEIAPLSDEDNDARALEESKQTYASLDGSVRKRLKRVNQEFLALPADPILIAANFNPAHTYEDLDCSEVTTPSFAHFNSSIDIAGRYALLMTPDGHVIRISKKLGELVCCVSGEEQDDHCVDQLKKWRQKIADSPVTPSPGNFMDILDLLHTLKDGSL
jgi:hypothetical protein